MISMKMASWDLNEILEVSKIMYNKHPDKLFHLKIKNDRKQLGQSYWYELELGINEEADHTTVGSPEVY